LHSAEIYDIFAQNYLTVRDKFDFVDCKFKKAEETTAQLTISVDGKNKKLTAVGNGRLDAVSNALREFFGVEYVLTGYEQHALTTTSKSQAISYVGIEANGKTFWGAGIDDDIMTSSIKAIISAVNNLMA
jgi:2-isopropylmalate synthase